MRNLGIGLIIVGIIMMFFTGFNLVTKKEVADIGSLEISKKEDHSVQWTPIVGIVVLVTGITFVGLAKSKKEGVI